MPGGKKKGKGKRRVIPNDAMIVASSRSTGAGLVNFVKEDLTRRQARWLLTETPPMNISNQIHWVKATSQFARQSVSNTVQTEANFSFALSDLNGVVGLSGFFDQYCIYSVTCSLTPNYIVGSSNTQGFGSLCTAIDYDNIANLGTITAVAAFGTSNMMELSMGVSVQRFIKPAVATALYSGSAFSNFGIGRTWVDSVNTSTPHYGIRSIYANNQVSGLIVDYDFTYVVGFRNNN